MRLLACGPRNLDSSAMPVMCDAMRRVLLAHFPFEPGFVMAHGAARGADFLWEDALVVTYERWPELWLPIRHMPARWATEGKAAGPLRNQRMLEQVQPTDTPGTADMVRRLRGAGRGGNRPEASNF
jgi:hypothetical protein